MLKEGDETCEGDGALMKCTFFQMYSFLAIRKGADIIEKLRDKI